jgi:hypothetical protein
VGSKCSSKSAAKLSFQATTGSAGSFIMHWYGILYQEGDKKKDEYGLLSSYLMVPVYLIQNAVYLG